MNYKMLAIENRISLLTKRDPVGNIRIVNKLRRRLRQMKDE